METEIKTNIEATTDLPKFQFITDLPFKSLYIEEKSSIENSGGRIVEIKQDDARAGDGKRRVRLTASSDATDLVGDVMSKNALVQMKNAAAGTTIFLNHSTNVPEDLFGSVEKAELVSRAFKVVDAGKEKILNLTCLDYDVIVEETNPRAVQTWEAIDAGNVKLGASITIAIIDKSPLEGSRRLIDDVIYLETSIVGIPCNQTAWVQYVKSKSWIHQAKKSLRASAKNEISTEPVKVEDTPVDVEELLKIQNGVEVVTAMTIAKELDNRLEKSETKATMTEAVTAKEFGVAFKDFFTEEMEEFFENPWLYMDLLSYALMEILYWNTGMPTEEKLGAAGEMIEAFKIKMLEVLTEYFREIDAADQKQAEFLKSFNAAAAEQMAVIMKAGRSISKENAKKIQNCHDIMTDLGAECALSDDEESKTIMETEEVKKSEEVITKAENLAVTVKVPELEEVQTALAEIKAQVDTLSAKNTELETKMNEQREAFEKKEKALNADITKWKAGALTATALLESISDQPAPRPGK